MDIETIKNNIKTLGRNDFKKVIYMILPKIFNLEVVNVNGQYDGGSDWSVFKDTGGTHTIAVQDTVQNKDWQTKAKSDAKKAIEHGATRFFFITPKSISRLTIASLENDITSTYKIPVTCLGSKEISELIINANLVTDFLDAIDAPLAAGVAGRLDKQEICLHAYIALGKDSDNLKNTVYEDSILITLYNEGPLVRDILVEKTIALLSCEQGKASQISRRIDSLLTKGKLIMIHDKKLSLMPNAQKDLENAERIYLKEFKSLVSAQTSLMESEHIISWSLDDSQKASVFLAKVFIQQQLETAKSAKLKMTAMGLFKNLGQPLQELRDFLRSSGVPPDKLEDTIKEMLIHAQELPIVKKLIRAAIFVALEGIDAVAGAKAIGAPRWSDVGTMLDASVAIPYLCARLFQPTKGRFSSGNYRAVETLQKLSVYVCIPYFYINECASHLLRARNYHNLDNYAEQLQYSQNAFIAHYYQLKNSGQNVPDNLIDYLVSFAPSCKQTVSIDQPSLIRKVMTNLQPLFHEYGIEFEEIPGIPPHYSKDVEIEYSFYLEQLQRHKSSRLIEHDILAVSHLKRQIAEKYEHWVLLTWDRAMISLGEKLDGCGWIISPDVLYEFAKPYRPISESQFCTLAHAIARTQYEPLAISAQVIDRVVRLAGDRIQDWELRKKIDEFTSDLLNRIDLKDARYYEWVDSETDEFLKGLDIEINSLDESEP